MYTKITLVLMLSLFMVSCSVESDRNYQTSDGANLILPQIDDQTQGGTCSEITCLMAGQNTDIGIVYFDADGTTITICYEITEPGWTIDATHLWIGNCDDRPANNPGNPLIGQFPYSETHAGATSYCYTIVQDPNWDPTGVCIAAHAEATGPTQETAWGCGDPYGGASWAMVWSIDLTECPSP